MSGEAVLDSEEEDSDYVQGMVSGLYVYERVRQPVRKMFENTGLGTYSSSIIGLDLP